MKLSLATNWDEALLEGLNSYAVDNLFGSLTATVTGGGRPSYTLPRVKKRQAEKFIKLSHDKGIKFNYLLSGSCLGGKEYEGKTHRQLIEHLKWLDDMGVEYVTVTIPYFIELIKEQFPRMKVIASVIAHINSANRARYYESLGADVICLDYMINRDFKAIREIREAVSCELEVLMNDFCLYHCPYRYYHYNCCSHSSQPSMNGWYLDYSLLRCRLELLSNPAQIIRAPWIRPEDAHKYESLGIDMFKMAGRTLSTPRLLNILKAYSCGEYNGNLLDLASQVFPLPTADFSDPEMQMMRRISHIPVASRTIKNMMPQVTVDNKALDGFLEHFEAGKCTSLCYKCNYCEKWAQKAVTMDSDSIERFQEAMNMLLKSLTTSQFLKYTRYLKLLRV